MKITFEDDLITYEKDLLHLVDTKYYDYFRVELDD